VGIVVSVGMAAIVSAAIVDAIETAVAPVSTGRDTGAAAGVVLQALSVRVRIKKNKSKCFFIDETISLFKFLSLYSFQKTETKKPLDREYSRCVDCANLTALRLISGLQSSA